MMMHTCHVFSADPYLFESSTVEAASRLTVRSLMAVFTVMVTIWTDWIDKVGIIDAKLESLLSLCVCSFFLVLFCCMLSYSSRSRSAEQDYNGAHTCDLVRVAPAVHAQ